MTKQEKQNMISPIQNRLHKALLDHKLKDAHLIKSLYMNPKQSIFKYKIK